MKQSWIPLPCKHTVRDVVMKRSAIPSPCKHAVREKEQHHVKERNQSKWLSTPNYSVQWVSHWGTTPSAVSTVCPAELSLSLQKPREITHALWFTFPAPRGDQLVLTACPGRTCRWTHSPDPGQPQRSRAAVPGKPSSPSQTDKAQRGAEGSAWSWTCSGTPPHPAGPVWAPAHGSTLFWADFCSLTRDTVQATGSLSLRMQVSPWGCPWIHWYLLSPKRYKYPRFVTAICTHLTQDSLMVKNKIQIYRESGRSDFQLQS